MPWTERRHRYRLAVFSWIRSQTQDVIDNSYSDGLIWCNQQSLTMPSDIREIFGMSLKSEWASLDSSIVLLANHNRERGISRNGSEFHFQRGIDIEFLRQYERGKSFTPSPDAVAAKVAIQSEAEIVFNHPLIFHQPDYAEWPLNSFSLSGDHISLHKHLTTTRMNYQHPAQCRSPMPLCSQRTQNPKSILVWTWTHRRHPLVGLSLAGFASITSKTEWTTMISIDEKDAYVLCVSWDEILVWSHPLFDGMQSPIASDWNLSKVAKIHHWGPRPSMIWLLFLSFIAMSMNICVSLRKENVSWAR
jgi:hypothetical protein